MIIDKSFKDAIAKAFYDKSINLYNIAPVVDELGGETNSFELLVSNIECNVQTVTQDIVKKEYGSDVVGENKITLEKINAIKIPDVDNPVQAVSFKGVYFLITGAKFFDSHTELIVKRFIG